MEKIYTSLKLLVLGVLLTSAVKSYWSYPAVKAYEYPKKQKDLLQNWYEQPQGIFSVDVRQGTVEVSVIAPEDISRGTDTDQCDASITVPDATYTGPGISWIMTGATTGSGTGQVGTRTFEKGNTIITYTVKDADGNVAEDSVEIIVADDQKPLLNIGTAISESSDPGLCTATMNTPAVTYSDNCSGEILSWTMSGATTDSGTGQLGNKTFNIGTTTISYTVTDAADNVATGELEITVTDDETPQLSIGNAISESTDPGQCTATIPIPAVSYSDNCSGESLSWTMSGATTGSGDSQAGTQTFNIGTTTISYVVTDAANNSTTGELEITVTDGEDPKLTIGNAISESTDPGQCTATIPVPAVSYSDNCSGESLSWTMSGATTHSGTGQVNTQTFNIGTTIISYVVTDAAGRSTTGEQEVTVTDEEVPQLTLGNTISESTDPGQCTATIIIPAVSYSDNCSGESLSWTMSGATTGSGDGQVGTQTFNIGTTIISYVVTDAANKSTTGELEITVTDEEAPQLTLGHTISESTDPGQCTATIIIPPVSYSDNCSGESLSWTMSGATTGSGDNQAGTQTFNIGTTIISYVVTDAANRSTTGELEVTVTDEEAPQLSLGNTISESTDPGLCTATIDIPAVSYSDNCSGESLSWTMSGATTGSGDNQAGTQTFNIGSTIISYVVTDAANNSTTGELEITVTDEEKPVISAGANISTTTDAGVCGASVIIPAATASDNCTVGTPTGTRDDGQPLTAPYPVGTTTITWNATDSNENAADPVSQTVTVSDNEKPVISAGADITVSNDPGFCYASLAEITASATDNCQTGIPQGTRSDGQPLNAAYPQGTTIITWTVTDANDNAALPVEQKITVEDKEAPVPPVLADVFSGCAYTFDVPVAVDNCTDNVAVTHDQPLTFSSTGTIVWTFTDAAGNASTAEQTVTIEPLVTIVADKIDVLCNGYATGEIRVTATGGVAPYTFDWGTLGAGDTKTDLPAGTYAVTAKDANGCETAPLEVTIEEPATFVEISSIKTTNGCYQQNNGTATVEATGGTGSYTYLWDNGQTTQTATDLAPGSHAVTVTDSNGCSKERTFTVSAPLELKITGFLTTETTSYGSATGTATAQVAGGSPNYTFSWSNGATGQTARDLAAGTYTVTVTDANGCTATGEVLVLDSLDAVIIPTSICEGEEEIVRTSYFEVEDLTARGGTPGYTYEWNFGEYATPATATGPGPHQVKYSVIGDKRITLKVTDSKGLTVEKQIIQYVGGCFANDCGSNDLQAENYFVGDAYGNKITSDNCAESGQKYLYIVFPTQSERYSLNIEYIYSVENLSTGEILNDREAGCYYEHQAIPTIAKTIPIDYSCGDKIKIEGIYLTFSNNSKWECGQGPNPKCYSTNNETSVTIPLYGVAFPNELLCNGGTSGIINTRASGGTGGYTYKLISSPDGDVIRPSQSSSSFTELPAGKYRVAINDGLEEYTTAEVEIRQPSNPLTLELVSQTGTTCYGGSDGTATVSASGGTPNTTGEPYIYIWEGIGQTTATATNLSAGTYNVRVLDANGCEAALEVIIEEPAQVTANAGPDQVLPCGNLSTFLQAVFNPEVIEGETIPQGTWSIVNGPAGGVIENVNDPNSKFSGVTGTYTLRWTVPCGATDDVKISFSNCSTLDFDGIDDHVVIGDKFDLPAEFTLEAWVKQDPAHTAGIKTIVAERDLSAINAGGFDLIIDNNVPKFRWNGSTISSAYPIGSDRWYHIAVILGGDFAGLYVDGIKVSEAVPGQPTATNFPLLIGAAYNSASPSSPENYFHGWIEEVRIWKRAQTEEQLQFLMNQRLNVGSNPLQGSALPIPVPGALDFNTSLIAYYPLLVPEITNGITKDKGPNGYDGKMINIQTVQQNTAPLPYYSAKNGAWTADDTWLRPAVWDHPNSRGVDGTFIDWNIVVTKHNITSQNKDITVLGLRNEVGKLSMYNPSSPQSEINSGQMLRVSHYLKLDGVIDLFGESQLIQDEGSILDPGSTGLLERDQQGTASSYNYNYWTSPVSLSTGNVPYAIKSVMKDGTTTRFQDLNFGSQYHYADGPFTSPRRVSSYWLHKFHGTANNYFEWEHIGTTEGVPVAEGFSMKGTSGYASNTDLQNYTFVGMPNNGTIELTINETPEGENYLVGNPYPSAISARKFIEDNITSGDIASSSFNGTLYFWDHFAKTTHYLEQYIGGYAVYNLAGSIEPASSVDSRIDNSDPGRTGSKRPGDFIPVGQAFFVNTLVAVNDESITSTGGTTVRFRNDHREYIREIDKTNSGQDQSVFHSAEKKWPKGKSSAEKRMRIWFKYRSPMGYHRQVLVTADANTTSNFDLGYDAPLMDDNIEDMFWLIHESEFVIQGVPDFNKDRVLPLGTKINKDGVIKIEIDDMENIPIDLKIYLKDELTGEYHDLRTASFQTTAEAGTTKDRFSIVFHKETEEGSTPGDTEEPDEDEGDGTGDGDNGTGDENSGEKPEENLPVPPDLDLYYLNKTGELVINNPGMLSIKIGTLYNGLGQKIMEFRSIPAETKVELPVQLNVQGIYIFKLQYGNESKSVKFIVE